MLGKVAPILEQSPGIRGFAHLSNCLLCPLFAKEVTHERKKEFEAWWMNTKKSGEIDAYLDVGRPVVNCGTEGPPFTVAQRNVVEKVLEARKRAVDAAFLLRTTGGQPNGADDDSDGDAGMAAAGANGGGKVVDGGDSNDNNADGAEAAVPADAPAPPPSAPPAGVPISLDGQWFGVDGGNLPINQFDLQADLAHLAQVPPVQWPLACVTFGTEYLTCAAVEAAIEHARVASPRGRLGVGSVIGLDGANASLMVSAVSYQHPARGRGIELVI